MSVFEIFLVFSELFSLPVAGFFFSYAIVITLGITNLTHRRFILTAQVPDRIIQDNHSLYVHVRVGLAIALTASLVFHFGRNEGNNIFLNVLTAPEYILDVQISTRVTHLPLNNIIQEINAGSMDPLALVEA